MRTLARADIGLRSRVIGGNNFDQAGGQPAHNIARWDGENWHALGSGASQGLGTDTESYVQNAAVVNGDLVLTGDIHEAGGAPADYFAIWRGERPRL